MKATLWLCSIVTTMLTQSIYATPLIHYQYSYPPKSLYKVWNRNRNSDLLLFFCNRQVSNSAYSATTLGERVNRNEAHETVAVHRQSPRRAATTAAPGDRPQANARKLKAGTNRITPTMLLLPNYFSMAHSVA